MFYYVFYYLSLYLSLKINTSFVHLNNVYRVIALDSVSRVKFLEDMKESKIPTTLISLIKMSLNAFQTRFKAKEWHLREKAKIEIGARRPSPLHS